MRSLALPFVLFLTAFGLGTHVVQAYRAGGGVQDFYQWEFGPAVMLACGRGYRPPAVEKLPALETFLRLESDRFDCASLPAVVPTYPALNAFQHVSRYLLMSVAATWRIVGVSWSRLDVLGGVLFAAVVTLGYGIARVGLGPVWALAAAVPLLWSPLAFSMLPNYRDYSKAPFILAMILVMARVVTGPGRTARLLGLAALGGAVAGVGLGFRTDVLITIVPFVIVLLALAPVTAPRGWLVRLAATGLFALTFAVLAGPVLADYSQGSNTGHVMLLGLMKPFDARLGVESSIYDLGTEYDDSLAFQVIDSYASRIEHRTVVLGSHEYDRASFAVLGDVARTMPGDVLTRALAAMRRIPSYFLREYLSAPPWVRSRLASRFYYVRGVILDRCSRVAPFAVALAMLIVAGRSIRAGLFLLLVLVVLVGGTATQFHQRHFFHLEFVPWWAFAVLGHAALTARPDRRQIVRAAAFAAVCIAGAAVAVVATRAYQDRQMRGVFEAYLRAPTRPLTPPAPRAPDGLATALVVADLRGDRCPFDTVAVTLEGPDRRTVNARVDRTASEPTRVFFASYSTRDDGRAPSVTVEASARPCLTGVSRVDVTGLPLLLDAELEPQWRNQRLHQRLEGMW